MLPTATLMTSVNKPGFSVEPVAAPSTPPKSSPGKQALEDSPARMTQQGSVEIHIKSASALKPSGADGSADPYVMLKMPGAKFWKSSAVQMRTLDPTWDEKLQIEGVLSDFVSGPMLLKVMDKDVLKDDRLGRLELSLEPLKYQDVIHFDGQQLHHTPSGTISLSASWIPKHRRI